MRDRIAIETRWVIVEVERIGRYAKLRVTDELTGVKADAVGPAHGYDEVLRRTAIRKLMLKLAERR